MRSTSAALTNHTLSPVSASPEAAFLVLPPGRATWPAAIGGALSIAAVGMLFARSHPAFAMTLGIAATLMALIALLTLAPPWQPLRLTQSGLSFATVFKRFDLRWTDVRTFGMAHLGGVRLVCITYARPAGGRPRFGLFDWFLPSHYGMAAEGLARTLEHTRARLSVHTSADTPQ